MNVFNVTRTITIARSLNVGPDLESGFCVLLLLQKELPNPGSSNVYILYLSGAL